MPKVLSILRARDRGLTETDWLKSHHTFSFGDYWDPNRQRFGVLRVLNDDVVAPGRGFARHGHRDMEILSYVLSGTLQHEDSLGNGSAIVPGDVQLLSAGRGVEHSEWNGSSEIPVHFLQMWILPTRAGGGPRYAQRSFDDARRRAGWCLLASPDGDAGSVALRQDARLSVTVLDVHRAIETSVAAGRDAYIQIASGHVRLEDESLEAGDGVGLRGVHSFRMTAETPAEILWFDLPAGDPHGMAR